MQNKQTCFCSDCGDWGNVDLTLQLMALFCESHTEFYVIYFYQLSLSCLNPAHPHRMNPFVSSLSEYCTILKMKLFCSKHIQEDKKHILHYK